MQTVAQRLKALHEQRAEVTRAEESCIDADFPLDTSSVSYYFFWCAVLSQTGHADVVFVDVEGEKESQS